MFLRRLAIIGCLAIAALTPGCGCGSAADTVRGWFGGAEPPPGPKQTVATLWELRDRRSYTQMEPHIVPAQARATTDLLAACDSFLTAESQLRDAVRDRVGMGISQLIDLSDLGYNLDIFSRGVELLDEVIDGDRALVSYTINSGVPARTASFRKSATGWLYDPGERSNPNLARAFRQLADGLRRTQRELLEGTVSADAIRKDPNVLLRRLQLHLAPGLKLLPPPPKAVEPGPAGASRK
jgi:hypothetical protein